MNNKILVKVIFMPLEKSYDIYIPVNEYVWKIKRLIIKSITDMNSITMDFREKFIVLNRDTSVIYNENDIVIDTDIRNGTELIFIKA